MIFDSSTGLLLIDIQEGLDEWDYYGGERNNLGAESNAAKILTRFRELEYPIFHVRHSSADPNSPLHATKPGFQIKKEVQPLPNEPIITKSVNSAFIGTDLEEQLKKNCIKTLVIVGLTTNHCVSTSVRMAANLGFNAYVISDATAAFKNRGANGVHFDAETMHRTSLASLDQEFAQIVSTDSFLTSLP